MALALETVPGDWSDALVTISNEQVPDVVSGTTLTPVPLESSLQFGDRGIVPSQEGHFNGAGEKIRPNVSFRPHVLILLISGLIFGLLFLRI